MSHRGFFLQAKSLLFIYVSVFSALAPFFFVEIFWGAFLAIGKLFYFALLLSSNFWWFFPGFFMPSGEVWWGEGEEGEGGEGDEEEQAKQEKYEQVEQEEQVQEEHEQEEQ